MNARTKRKAKAMPPRVMTPTAFTKSVKSLM